tara:strand:- start:69 stop:524 length:456 start_codon:yes stop_codon:yes gene_type:complete
MALTKLRAGAFPSGTIIQTVSAELENDNVTSSTSFVDTGVTASITPSSTSNKIIVTICIPMNAHHDNTDVQVSYKVLRDSTALGDAVFGDHSGNGTRSDLWTTAHFAYVDSPSSTSSLTYKVQHKAFNTDIVSTASHSDNKCTIILQELVA